MLFLSCVPVHNPHSFAGTIVVARIVSNLKDPRLVTAFLLTEEAAPILGETHQWCPLIIVLLIPFGTRHIVLVHPWPNCDGKPAICSECSSARFWLLYLVCSIVERTLGTYFKSRFHRSQSFYLFWWNPRGQTHPCSDGKPLDPVFLSWYRSYRTQQVPCYYTGTDPTEPRQSFSFVI